MDGYEAVFSATRQMFTGWEDMMAMDTTLDKNGCTYKVPQGTPEENAKLDASYEHLCKMRDELVTLNIVPPISEWNKINPNL